ncbi:unnamed protein product [Macrosiphum euphorbiae]|nr:unnamed protein product [Macrosiphum euphorbiae]
MLSGSSWQPYQTMCPELVNRCTRVFTGKWYSGTDRASTTIRSYCGTDLRRDYAEGKLSTRRAVDSRGIVGIHWCLIVDTGQSTSESRGDAVVRGCSNSTVAVVF